MWRTGQRSADRRGCFLFKPEQQNNINIEREFHRDRCYTYSHFGAGALARPQRYEEEAPPEHSSKDIFVKPPATP